LQVEKSWMLFLFIVDNTTWLFLPDCGEGALKNAALFYKTQRFYFLK
jgi:hypothetical protein